MKPQNGKGEAVVVPHRTAPDQLFRHTFVDSQSNAETTAGSGRWTHRSGGGRLFRLTGGALFCLEKVNLQTFSSQKMDVCDVKWLKTRFAGLLRALLRYTLTQTKLERALHNRCALLRQPPRRLPSPFSSLPRPRQNRRPLRPSKASPIWNCPCHRGGKVCRRNCVDRLALPGAESMSASISISVGKSCTTGIGRR